MTPDLLLGMLLGAALAGVAFGALGLYLRARRDRDDDRRPRSGWDRPVWPRDERGGR